MMLTASGSQEVRMRSSSPTLQSFPDELVEVKRLAVNERGPGLALRRREQIVQMLPPSH